MRKDPVMRFAHLAPVGLLLITACKKDASPNPAPGEPAPNYAVSDFSLLETGNYWVYQRSNLDTAGNVSGMTGNYDSLFVSGTMDVNGITYAILSKAVNGVVNPGMQELRRDSADHMVDGNGKILFRYGVFDELAWMYVDPFIFQYEWYVTGATTPLVVPAGTFDAHTLSCELTQIGTLIPPATDRDLVSWWAAGVGKVRDDQYYYNSGTGIRRDLVRYYVQQ